MKHRSSPNQTVQVNSCLVLNDLLSVLVCVCVSLRSDLASRTMYGQDARIVQHRLAFTSLYNFTCGSIRAWNGLRFLRSRAAALMLDQFFLFVHHHHCAAAHFVGHLKKVWYSWMVPIIVMTSKVRQFHCSALFNQNHNCTIHAFKRGLSRW